MRSKRSTYTAARRFSVTVTFPGALAAVAANYGKFFVADQICTVMGIRVSYQAQSTDAGAGLIVERLQGVEVSGAGDALAAEVAVDAVGQINITQIPALTGGAVMTLAVGDRLNLIDNVAGVTALAGVCVTVDMEEALSTLRSKVAMYDTRRVLVSIHLPGTVAGTAANYGVIFICPGTGRYIFVGAEEIHTAPAGAAATLTLEKLEDGEALGAGDVLLAATLDLQGAAETPQYGSIAGITVAARTLGAGDRIALVDAGNVANVRNCQVTIELEELLPIRAKRAPTEKEQIFVAAVLYGAQPQTAAMHDKFFTASKPCRVIAAREVHTTASADALEFIQLERLQGTEVPGTGDNLLTNNANKGFDGNGAAETVQAGTLTAVAADLVLAIGDRLALDPVDGNLGTLAGVCVTVELEAIQ